MTKKDEQGILPSVISVNFMLSITTSNIAYCLAVSNILLYVKTLSFPVLFLFSEDSLTPNVVCLSLTLFVKVINYPSKL